ncbi:hypothetical protein LTR84_007881 [Exophiala bonariae]|uniref:Small ribosomal subunit protein uS9m n=1 Tax=Exophiala bonariae TaxID=1690606 RepID=A0AAV9NPX9_9EURO|nr:hypothetical protein LTR84_007881 [Exophiala bonariae]
MTKTSIQHLSSTSRLSWTCCQCRSQSASLRPQWRQSQAFSTTTRSEANTSIQAEDEIRAAPEIDFDKPDLPKQVPARIIPSSPSYFTGSPQLNDNILLLQSLVEKYAHVPTVTSEHTPRAYWKSLGQYRSSHGERVSASSYSKILQLLNQLNRIHPSFCPKEVSTIMESFHRPGIDRVSEAKPGKIDQSGRSLGVGRRKEATARVWLVEGTGEVLVNGKTIAHALPRLHDRESALWALTITERVDKYNVFALVEGGGTTGQAESITLALAKALLVHEPALKPALRRAGCVTSDARRVERKKPGHVKARKMPTWVKR